MFGLCAIWKDFGPSCITDKNHRSSPAFEDVSHHLSNLTARSCWETRLLLRVTVCSLLDIFTDAVKSRITGFNAASVQIKG